MKQSPEWQKWNRKVHALAAELDIDHETLSQYVRVTFKVDSMTKLAIPKLRALYNRLRKEWNKTHMVSKWQIGRIYGLGYKVLGWDSKGILGFITTQTKRSCGVQHLMMFQASKVITGMEMIAMEKGLI